LIQERLQSETKHEELRALMIMLIEIFLKKKKGDSEEVPAENLPKELVELALKIANAEYVKTNGSKYERGYKGKVTKKSSILAPIVF
jgi:hypothetical protein